MTGPARAGFWLGAGLAGWTLAGYPLALLLAAPRPWLRSPRLPSVSIVVPAYCEVDELPQKLSALVSLDYPADLLEVIVVVSGNPRLAKLARAASARAVVLEEPERAGKAAALNRGIAEASGELVLLTDANNILDRGTVRACARHFGDPQVWGVVGRRGESGSLYDTYEDLVRRLESSSGSVAAGSGELFAVRRDRLPRFPAGVVNDDLWLSAELARHGGRVVYEPAATSTEPALGRHAELERRTRIGAGRAMLTGHLLATPPGVRWRFVSHKLLRLALPAALVSMLAGAIAASVTAPAQSRRRWRIAALVQLAAYAAALRRSGSEQSPATQVVLGNVATARGVARAARGRQGVRWERVR